MTYNGRYLFFDDEFVGPFCIIWGQVLCEYTPILNESYESDIEVSFPEWATLIVGHKGDSTEIKVRDLELFLDLNAVKTAIQESIR